MLLIYFVKLSGLAAITLSIEAVGRICQGRHRRLHADVAFSVLKDKADFSVYRCQTN